MAGILTRARSALDVLRGRPPEAEPARMLAAPGVGGGMTPGLQLVRTANPQEFKPDGAAIRAQGFSRHPVVHACIRVVADIVASVPLIVLTARGDRESRVPESHPLQQLLDYPNQRMSARKMRARYAVDYLGYGNALFQLQRPSPGRPPLAFRAINPESLQSVWVDAEGDPARYDYGDWAGRIVEVAAENIFDEDMVHTVEFSPFGSLEAYPNGDAAEYARRFGIADSAQEVGRYALRWPGHVSLWRALVGLGFLEQKPVPGLGAVTPREFMIRHLEPRLQYAPGQRDAVILRVEARGEGGASDRLVLELIDFRDRTTGLMAMNRTVGFPASIAAQMLASGEIKDRGLLSPIQHMPWATLVEQLSRRGIAIVESAG